MSNYTYTTDLIADVLERAGEPTGGTSDFASRVLRYLNRAYTAILKGGGEFAPDIDEPWLWLKKRPPGSLILQPKISAGVISVARDSALASLSSIPSVDVSNYFLFVNSEATWYRVLTQSGAAITLDSTYVGVSDASATYTLHKLEYTLPTDFLRLTSVFRSSWLQEIGGLTLEALEREYPTTNLIEGYPRKFAFVTGNVVRMSHSPSALMRVEFQYLYRPAILINSSSQEPVIPLDYRHLLSDIATFYTLIDKHSDKAAGLTALIRGGIEAMARDNKYDAAKMDSLFATAYPRKKHTRDYRTSESGIYL